MIKVKWDKVLSNTPIIRFINLGNGTMYRIAAFYTNCCKIGDYPRDGLQLSIERVGSFLFPISKYPFETLYIQEKLNLYASDASIIADWLNAQLELGEATSQHYSECYVNFEHMYSLMADTPPEILNPKIILEMKDGD